MFYDLRNLYIWETRRVLSNWIHAKIADRSMQIEIQEGRWSERPEWCQISKDRIKANLFMDKGGSHVNHIPVLGRFSGAQNSAMSTWWSDQGEGYKRTFELEVRHTTHLKWFCNTAPTCQNSFSCIKLLCKRFPHIRHFIEEKKVSYPVYRPWISNPGGYKLSKSIVSLVFFYAFVKLICVCTR